MKKLRIISLGGSLIIPEKLNTAFLSQFKRLILARVKKGDRFIIITGGGGLCREYNAALKSIASPKPQDLDWMGINITWINAKLVQLAFGKAAHPEIATDPLKVKSFKEPILVGGGWKPGRSSDGAAVQYAKSFKADAVINLSNIEYVYEQDPKKYPGAKKLKELSWKGFLKITGTKWQPGANLPFDPTAAQLAQKSGIKVIITKGSDLKNLEKILSGQPAKGTTVQ